MEQSNLFKVVEIKQNNNKKYQIDTLLLPYLFNFSSKILRQCKLSDQLKNTNPIAIEMFQYLKTKLLPKRKYSKSGRTPTRMKTEQKIKFIMRCLQNNIAKIYNRPAVKLINFNLQQQRIFFKRTEVCQHFLGQISKIVEEKQRSNTQKVKQIQNIIIDILRQGKINQRQAKRMFERDIKQKQLPWSIDMFTDIEQFCKDIYRDFIKNDAKTDLIETQQELVQIKLNFQLSNQTESNQQQADIIFQTDAWLEDEIIQKEQKKCEQANTNQSITIKSQMKMNVTHKK